MPLKRPWGVFYMTLGVTFLTIGEAILKLLTDDYTPFQILFIRSFISLPFLLCLWKRKNSLGQIFHLQLKAQLIRSGTLTLALLFAIFSLSLIPLFQYSSLFFSSPFFMVMFSALLLGEKVTKNLWLILCIGFGGVILVFNPSSDLLFEIGSLAALVSAVLYGLGMVLTSKLSRTTSPLLMTIWYTSTCFIVGLFGTLGSTFSLSWNEFFLFSLAAFLNIGANLSIPKSFQFAQVSFLDSLEYIAIPLSFLLGYWLWMQLPEPEALVGSFLIICSGLYIFKRENKDKVKDKDERLLSGDII